VSRTIEIRSSDMIKTLRITSILLAFLAAGLLVFPGVFGFRDNKKAEEFLNLPSVVAKFQQAQGLRANVRPKVSPLVTQAEIFRAYLNYSPPPPPPPPPPEEIETEDDPPPPPLPPSPRFTVIATSFYAAQPGLSLALVDETGAGRYWVRPGDVVSRLIIDEIRDGVVVTRGGSKVFEQPVEARPPQRSLEGSPSPVLKEPSKPVSSTTISPTLDTQDSGAAVGTAVESSESAPAIPEDQAALIAQMMEELEAMAAKAKKLEGVGPGVSTAENAASADKAVSESEVIRIGGNKE
jgi:hypothetical protein